MKNNKIIQNQFVIDLMKQMTIEEKIGQLYQTAIMGEFDYGPAFEQNDLTKLIKEGKVGSLVGPYDNHVTLKLQKLAVEKSRLGIPLMFDNDIIHGCRTGFPVNLALAGSFDMDLVEKAARVMAYETSHSGTHVTLSPMLDIVRDPRWGRVVESPGEDPYLASQLAESYVKGWTGNDIKHENHVGVCLKHFVGYGASEAGRDYNHVDISERMLKQVYLKPFEAGVNAGASMVMSAFNVYQDIPVTANKYLLRDILRDQLGFKGVTISDYTSSEEIINHKIVETDEEVASMCLEAGLDIELISKTYMNELKSLSKKNQHIATLIDEACYRVLDLKYQLGLFEKPYKNIYVDFEKYWLLPEHRKISLDVSRQSIVMLKNLEVLPIDQHKKLCLVGPFAKTNHLVGPWGGKVRNEDCITFEEGMKKVYSKLDVFEGAHIKAINQKDLNDALEAAQDADVIVVAVGEDQWESGEAHSKTDPSIHQAQIKLIKALRKLNKPMVGVIFSGRPLIITDVVDDFDALLYAWFLGTETGDALADVISGITNPSARLAMTFPRSVGQIPIYYNHMKTGRPYDQVNHPNNHYTSRYLDSVNEPLYPFGYGLSYSNYQYSNFSVEVKDHQILVHLNIDNLSEVDGYEIVQVYIEALSFSVTRPVNELKGFKKVMVPKKTSVHVTMTLKEDDFAYYNKDMISTHENKKYFVKVARNALDIMYQEIVDLGKKVTL